MTDTDPATAGAVAEDTDFVLKPGEIADLQDSVRRIIPNELWDLYEFFSYRNAALLLSESQGTLFLELMAMLRRFSIDTTMIREPGGNESRIVKRVSDLLRDDGWNETTISGDLNVKLSWRKKTSSDGKTKTKSKEIIFPRKGFLDGHKIDYVKGKVAFDMEWNSKDQTFDRDLYAFRAFYEAGAIDVGVILTRGFQLDTSFFRSLGKTLNKDGTTGTSEVYTKFGASTTWMGKLLYRLEAGRNGGCPVLAVGITPKNVTDWSQPDAK